MLLNNTTAGGKKGAIAARPRQCTMCRECVRTEKWSDKVDLRRVKDHFIFSIESTGCLPAKHLMVEAVKVLMQKSANILGCLDSMAASSTA